MCVRAAFCACFLLGVLQHPRNNATEGASSHAIILLKHSSPPPITSKQSWWWVFVCRVCGLGQVEAIFNKLMELTKKSLHLMSLGGDGDDGGAS